MNRKKIIKGTIIIISAGTIIAISVFLYMYFMPHRDVQNAETDYSVTAKAIVNEYLKNSNKANQKYLDEEGDSKIFEVEGMIKEITEDFNNQKVVLLDGGKTGVSCTFTNESNKEVLSLKIGNKVKIKGVIRSGAAYDADLEMYENVIIEKASIVK